MSWNKPTTYSRVQGKTLEEIKADPELGPVARNVVPLSGLAKGQRKYMQKPAGGILVFGSGTFGTVVGEAFNEGNVATKYFTNTSGELRESIQEIAALNYLQGQPNIVPITGVVGSKPNTTDISFPGAMLGKAVSNLGKQAHLNTWEDIYATCLQVLRGYYTLHSLGIAHRDTKPQNLLRSSLGEVWISDFGASKYLDSRIPPSEDNYPGTFAYASPEGLMNWDGTTFRKTINYFKADSWAVGSVLYELVTGKRFIPGDDKAFDNMEEIIVRKGTPVAADGIVFDIYNGWKKKKTVEAFVLARTGNAIFPQDVDAVRGRVTSRAKFKTAATEAAIDQMADVIAGLMEYNPENRLSIEDALQMPGMPGLPPAIERPLITAQYVDKVDFPAWVTKPVLKSMCENVFKHIGNICTKKSLPFILDRACCYMYAFLTLHKEDPFCVEENQPLIEIGAVTIASMLFESSASGLDLDDFFEEMVDWYVNEFTKAQVRESIKLYMLSPIQFLGRTFYDTVLLSLPSLTRELIETYGLLNFDCYAESLFPINAGKLDILKDEMIQFVTDGRLATNIHLTQLVRNSATATLPATRSNFVNYATPSEGGRRKRIQKSRRVKRRKQNTTLKVRNG